MCLATTSRAALFSRVLALVLTPAFLGICSYQTARAGDWHGRLRVQIGQEYDTNALRVYRQPESSESSDDKVAPDFLTRMVLRGQIDYSSGQHHAMLDYLGGLKLFYHQTSEHLLATRIQSRYQFSRPKGNTTGVRLMLHDTLQAADTRDYRLISGEVFQRIRPLAWLVLELQVGGRHYNFKPDVNRQQLRFSNLGPNVGLRLQALLSKAWSVTALYRMDVKFFDHLALTLPDTTSLLTRDRQDQRHTTGLQARFQINWWKQYRLIVQGSYFLSHNDSNSLGSSALWHRLRTVVSMQLPLQLSLHLMGTIQFTNYLDGLYVDKWAYEPDADENENSLAVRITYKLWKNLSLVLHGAIYRNDFHSSEIDLPQFERETIMLGLSYGLSF